jgi:hypothetical protein
MRRRTDTQRDGLELRALYSVAALARIANLRRFKLTRLLRANSVQFIVAGRARYVPLVEIRDEIPPLFESPRASEEVRRRDEAETDPES